MATFSIGEIVRARGSNRGDRLEGVIKFLTCSAATASGGATCDRKTCSHNPKTRAWVKWPDGHLCSYQMHELETDIEGEEEVLSSMTELLDTEEAEDATQVVKMILQARKNRASKPTEKVEKMSSTGSKSILEMVKADAGNAAYRVAAKQINTGLRNAIVEMLKAKGTSSAHIEGIAAFLETEWGAALLGSIAGHGLGYIPGIKDDPRVVRLAGEFRVSSMATVGNEIFTAALGQLLPVLTTALNSLPAEASSGQTTEGHKSTTEEMEIEIETDLSALEDHIAKEAKRKVLNGS